MARYYLVHASKRAIEKEDGSVQLRPDEKPDDIGFAALAIAQGEEPQLFSAVYARITNNEAPLHPILLKAVARSMMIEYQSGAAAA